MANKNKPKLKLIGTDGNAFSIIGAAVKVARKAGWTAEQISDYREKATSGDYDNVLRVTCELFDVQ